MAVKLKILNANLNGILNMGVIVELDQEYAVNDGGIRG